MKTNQCHLRGIRQWAAILLLTAAGGSARSGESISDSIMEMRRTGKTPALAVAAVRNGFAPMALESPNGAYSVVTTKRGRIKCRRTKDNVVERTFYSCSPAALAFSRDGGMLVCAGQAACGKRDTITIKVWHLPQGKLAAELNFPGKQADAVAISGERIILHSETGLHCFRVADGQRQWTVGKTRGICELKYSADERWIIASFEDGTVEIYSAETGIRRD